MGICELHAAEGEKGQGGLPEIDYHPIKGVGWGVGGEAPTPVAALHYKP